VTDTPSPAELLASQKGPRIKTARPKPSAVWHCCLREHRTRLGLTLGEVASSVGLTKNCIWQIEHGSDPMLSTAVKLAEFYGVAVEVIWKERIEKP
jgi:DNA-binding XRE family transcriptional regulator